MNGAFTVVTGCGCLAQVPKWVPVEGAEGLEDLRKVTLSICPKHRKRHGQWAPPVPGCECLICVAMCIRISEGKAEMVRYLWATHGGD